MKKLVLVAVAAISMAAQAADISAGKNKSVVCAACHGANGISIAPIYPNLKGQKAGYIETQLKAFKDGSRTNPIMQPLAQGLSDADITNLAAYFESLGK